MMGEQSGQRPVCAAIAVTWRGDDVLLVRRHNPPQAGLWGFPGGKINFGESVLDAAVRELEEEACVRGRARCAFDAVDVIDAAAPAAYHYLLVAVLVEWLEGEPFAADDVDEAAWFSWDAIPGNCSPNVARVARRARKILSR